MDALDARQNLVLLQEERALALARGLLADAAYRDELEEEIAACTRLYLTAAVTEVAQLHGVLFGRHQG